MATLRMKDIVDILGRRYTTDHLSNFTPRVLEWAERRLIEQTSNPLYLVSERIRHFFCEKHMETKGTRYDEFKFENPVVTTEENFDSLLIPKDHVSRGQSDTYYVNSGNLFRSHSSAHQTHCLQKESKSFITIADCYRRDEIDRSHFPVFHQCEVFKLFNHKDALYQNCNLSLYDKHNSETKTKQGCYSQEASSFVEDALKSTVESFAKDFFDNPNLKTRWVDAYFPFTHPSFELEVLWNDKWLELLGCGVVRDEILEKAGIRDHIGFAAGFGLERFGMLKYEIPDIRLFWSKDTGFLHQFENKSPFDKIKFKSFSNCPQCVNDLSFWLPSQGIGKAPFSPNDFYDLCRTIGGDLVEQVKLVDEFTHPKKKRTSHCYRIIYRAPDRVLTKHEVNEIHAQIASSCNSQFGVELR